MLVVKVRSVYPKGFGERAADVVAARKPPSWA